MSVPVEAWAAVPLASSVAFGLLAPPMSRRLPPRAATWLLSAGSVLLATSSVAVLGLIVVSVAGALPVVAWLGHWSAARVAAVEPFDPKTAMVAAAGLLVEACLSGWVAWRRGRRLLAAWSACRACASPLVVLPDRSPHAFALPGWPGRIVATTGLLEACTAEERRAVLAHEQAHLDARHDLHLAAVAIAAALDPALARVPRAARLASERWADESAARATGDRRVVADAIGRVARVRPPADGMFALPFGASHAEQRVLALLRRPPRLRAVPAGVLAGLGVAAGLSALVAAHDIAQIFEAARRVSLVVTGR